MNPPQTMIPIPASAMDAHHVPCRKSYAIEQKSRAGGPAFYVWLTIRVLLQVKFLSGPRTQNSSDLAAVDRALV